MQDNQIIQVFLPIIQQGLIADGYTTAIVKQAYQPTQQGRPNAPTVFFYKLGDKRYGFLNRSDVWNPGVMQMQHVENQVYETTFQFSALVLQNPPNPNAFTASDLVNDVAAILMSDNARTTMFNAGLQMLRITEVRNPYFVDDHDQFEASPSFDLVITHNQTRNSINPVINSFDYGVFPV